MVIYSIRKFLWSKYLPMGPLLDKNLSHTIDMLLLERSVLTHTH
jgi:hypothetical protein